MTTYDISNADAVNASFQQIIDANPDGVRNVPEFKTFGEMFFHLLTDNNRRLYHWVYPPRTFGGTEADERAHRIEGAILARQERMGFYD